MPVHLLYLLYLLQFIKLSQSWCLANTFPTNQPIVDMVVSPSNRHLAVLDVNHLVRIYHTSNYQLLTSYNMGDPVNVIRWSPNGDYLAVAGFDDKVRFLQGYQTFAVTKSFDGQVGSRIVGIDFSSDSKNIIVCGRNNGSGINKLALFTILNNGTWINNTVSISPASSTVTECQFSYYNNTISVNTGSRILLYDMTLNQIDQINPGSVTYHKIVMHPLSYSMYYIDSQHDELAQLDISSPPQNTFPGTNGPLNDLDMTSTGDYLAAGGNNADVYIYNSSREILLTISQPSTITALSFSINPQNPKLFVGDTTGLITILALNCTPQCPRDYYSSNNHCLLCSDSLPKCLMCLNAHVCDQCLDGYFVHPNDYDCVSCNMFGCLSCINSGYCTTCQQGFYIDGNKCKRCGESLEGCAICDTSTVCIACTNDYFLDTANNVCKNCSSVTPNCLKCTNSSNCTKCLTGYFLNAGACSPCLIPCLSCQNTAQNCTQCVKGYYQLAHTCLSCPSNCLSCNHTQYCFECIESMYQKTDGTCVLCIHPCKLCENASLCYACHQGYYLSLGLCNLCPTNCSTCNSTGYCASCLAGYFLVTPSYTCKACSQQYLNCEYCSGTVCEVCQSGYFLNSSTLCQHCSDRMFKCQTCNNVITCTSCNEGFFLTGLIGNFSCRSCDSGCQLCWNGFDCRVCYSNFYLDPDLKCKPCISNCYQCTDSSSCQVCDNGYYLETSSQTCIMCRDILTNCLECWNSSACTNCEVGFYLNPGDNLCKRCSSYCLTCNSTSCYNCLNGYYMRLVGGNYVCTACDQSCAECRSLTLCDSCKSGFYRDSTSSKCINCSITRNCRTCNNITCYSCLNGYHLDNYDGAVSNFKCKNCLTSIEGCIQCNSSANCLVCDYGYFLDSLTQKCSHCTQIEGCQDCSNNSTCLQCVHGYYLNAVSLCAPCSQGCATCSSPSICTSCTSKYYLLSHRCRPCQESLQGCLVCSSSSVCKECMNGFYLSSQQCVWCRTALVGCLYCNNSATCVSCQNGFYLDISTKKCLFCDKHMQGCINCLSHSVCLQCEAAYFLTSGGTGCTLCHSTLAGCVKCNNSLICSICLSGFYLHTNNTCRTCKSFNSGCQLCSNNSTGTFCVKCSSGYFLSPSTKLCSACQTIGCQICHEFNPDECVTCDSGYFKNVTHCLSCPIHLMGCNLCLNNSHCGSCQVGYFLDGSSMCSLCSQQIPGCSKCQLVSSLVECLQCKSLYLLDVQLKSCIPCSQLLEGCSYCVNILECISCENGYFKNLTTNLCVTCTNLVGCLLCESEHVCSFCKSSYYLSANKSCISCNQTIQFCANCISQHQCLTCQTGYQLRGNKSKCEKYIIQAMENPKDLKLFTEYVDSQSLKHTLMLRVGKFTNVTDTNDVKQMSQLYLTNYKDLRSQTSGRTISQIPLEIKQINYSTPNTLQFLTNNPTSSLLPQRRLLQSSSTNSLLQNFKVSLEMERELVNKILPDIYQTHALVIDYPLDKSQFYSSYLRHYSSDDEKYKIVGYIVLTALLLNFIHKTVKIQTLNEVNNHSTGEMICHMVGLKTIGMFFEHVDEKVFYLSQGFMLLDIPWFNEQISTALAAKSDHSPSIVSMYYTNMNLASTSLIALVVLIVLISVSFLMKEKKQLIKRAKYRQLVYNMFAFTLAQAGALSLQGSIMNPISFFSVNSFFYLLGIVLYLVLIGEMIWSIWKQTINLYKVRIIFKATMLSLCHVSPIVIVILTVIVDLVLMVGVYWIVDRKRPKWIYLQLLNHTLLNTVLILFLVMPTSFISIYASIALISTVLVIEILLNCKIVKHFEQNPHISFCCIWPSSKSIGNASPRINRRQKIRVQAIGPQQDSQQTIIDGNAQSDAEKQLRIDKMWQLEPGQIYIEDLKFKQQATQQTFTRYKDNSNANLFNASGLSFVSSDTIPGIKQNDIKKQTKPNGVKFIKAITNKVNVRPKILTKNIEQPIMDQQL